MGKRFVAVSSYFRKNGIFVSGHQRFVDNSGILLEENKKRLQLAAALRDMSSEPSEADRVLFALGPETSRWAKVGFEPNDPWWLWEAFGYPPDASQPGRIPTLLNRHSLRSAAESPHWEKIPSQIFREITISGMNGTFSHLRNFNSPVHHLDVSKSLNFAFTFLDAAAFNQPLDSWDVGKSNSFDSMFAGATSFNQPLTKWDIRNLQSAQKMFAGATSFNQPLNKWDTKNLQSAQKMFAGATSFNQPLNKWDTRKVSAMTKMFEGATSFDQNLGSWNIGNVVGMKDMFKGSGISPENMSKTLIGWSKQAKKRVFGLDLGEIPVPIHSLTPAAQKAVKKLVEEHGWIITGPS